MTSKRQQADAAIARESANVERARIATDLHNGAAQYIIAAKVALEGAESGDQLARVSRLLDQALLEIRAVGDNRDPDAESGISDSIREIALDRLQLPANLSLTNERFAPQVERIMTLIASEVLSNVARHADAHRVDILLDPVDDYLHLEITDDGVGGASLMTGIGGLTAILSRVHNLGGEFRIDSPPGAGTRIQVNIPLSPKPPPVLRWRRD